MLRFECNHSCTHLSLTSRPMMTQVAILPFSMITSAFHSGSRLYVSYYIYSTVCFISHFSVISLKTEFVLPENVLETNAVQLSTHRNEHMFLLSAWLGFSEYRCFAWMHFYAVFLFQTSLLYWHIAIGHQPSVKNVLVFHDSRAEFFAANYSLSKSCWSRNQKLALIHRKKEAC